MAEIILEKYSGAVAVLSVGAAKEEGGTRGRAVKAGGQKAMPFLFAEGEAPNPPLVAYEVWDTPPQDWPEELTKAWGSCLKDPFLWAEKCQQEYRAKLICLRLAGAHPDAGDKTPQQEAQLVKEMLKRVSLPLVIIGCGDDEKDNVVLPACSEAAKGERCLFGSATQDNYKTLTAACLADGHSIIAESPIDINIAKQLNILISDVGLPLGRIAINPTIGALGYGLEYAYSIMERARLAALAGDKALAMPFACFVGQEAWRAKERGVIWEALTAAGLLQAGADILVMRHPLAVEKANKHIERIFV
jgi:acetyl-CoA decarbonylase/synthase complex subunit delta